MSILLFSIGALAVMAGTAMVGFGFPVAEFSFGNTLIIAGSTTAVGGLVVIGLGAVVSKLQQITDNLATGPVRPVDAIDTGLRGAPGRVPVRPKANGEGVGRQAPEVRQIPPTQAVRAVDEPLPPPTLRNPELPPVPSEDEVSLSPHYPSGSGPDVGELGAPARPAPPDQPVQAPKEPRLERPRRPLATPTRSSGGYFDAVWPRKPARTPASESPAEPPVDHPLPDPRAELPRADTARADSLRAGSARPDSLRHDAARSDRARDLPGPDPTRPDRADVDLPRNTEMHGADARTDFPAADSDRTDLVGSDPERTTWDEKARDSEGPAETPKTPAILKSGVVDGMGYTLYVDGSIEAELPEGTLRFASINELRSHLEKNV